jgi:predicted AlkP superfamily pyrophosphatase or phosphodiesterase
VQQEQWQPDLYSGLELKDVIPSAIHALNPDLVATSHLNSFVNIPPSSHVVVLLIDGLGEIQLQECGDGLFLTRSTVATPMRTQFPSTTPVALGSLGTGETPGQHGFVGASFFLPEEGSLLAPLKWGSTPHPISMTPSAPLFEWAAAQGIDVASIAREKYRNSGLTASVLRGGAYLGAADLVNIEKVVLERMKKAISPALTYVYWPDLDRVGHVYGPGSSQWNAELLLVDSFISRLADAIMENPKSDISLVITSDHGMVFCPVDRRVQIESNTDLVSDVRLVAGDPRARHIYTRAGAARDAATRWQEVLGVDFAVVPREDLIQGGLFPKFDLDFHERLGDFMVIARSDAMLSSNYDRRTSSLLGQHGSISEAEMLIPLRIFHSGLNN